MAAALHSFPLHLLTSLVRGSPGSLTVPCWPHLGSVVIDLGSGVAGWGFRALGPVPLLPLGLEGCPRGRGRGVWGRLDDGRRWEGLEGGLLV